MPMSEYREEYYVDTNPICEYCNEEFDIFHHEGIIFINGYPTICPQSDNIRRNTPIQTLTMVHRRLYLNNHLISDKIYK